MSKHATATNSDEYLTKTIAKMREQLGDYLRVELTCGYDGKWYCIIDGSRDGISSGHETPSDALIGAWNIAAGVEAVPF